MRIAALIGAVLLIVFALFQGDPDQVAADDPMFDVRVVEIAGDLKYADPIALQQYYDQLLGDGLFDRSMAELTQFAQQPEWVDRAKIRRVWPHSIRIEVTEHRPLAFWNERQVLTAEGKVIAPKNLPDLPLTSLVGPADTETVVLDQFSLISQMLSTSSLKVVKLELEDRGAWDIWFDNGIGVKLGRNDVLDRLGRFVAVYKSDLSGRIDQISSVDARYPHGVAVKWKLEE
ncbi:cell division protein FtsQ/DivIB [Rhodanobacter aciditrophus]|uniref:Cell division protein FtsQ n=1 Tax=Rhodanobacter aciditrophus TaxID=1623218 RepID=A0ABW4B4L5_9GAMM